MNHVIQRKNITRTEHAVYSYSLLSTGYFSYFCTENLNEVLFQGGVEDGVCTTDGGCQATTVTASSDEKSKLYQKFSSLSVQEL